MVAVLAVVFPSPARAGTISIDTAFRGYGATFVVAGQGPESFVIGSLKVSQASELGTLDDLESFEAFCVDFSSSILDAPPPAVYNADLDTMTAWQDGHTPEPLEANGSGQRAAWLYNEYVPQLAALPEDPTLDSLGRLQRAALQMAIWNALYDDDFTVTQNSQANNHTYMVDNPLSTVDNDVMLLANQYLQGIAGIGGLEHAGASVDAADAAWLKLRYLDGTDAQDLIGPVAATQPVPEPSAALLLGMGVLSLAAFRSRKMLLRRA